MGSGKYIKRLRKEVGLTQKQFAEKVGIAQGNVSDLERNKYDITLSKFIGFCKKLKFKDFNKIINE
ncbi:helix-turn-helix domain-containing protein [Aquimarina sp. TRL1]|uniref:helix-turn-helix domain-containing protein n=1 Tax=Aquimarina sp. (strain TRL1) TaxID=2736252 RepID=UPI0020CB467F|nr:helix-turn-helix transcriptional regulator [Aquimarina sp. TRL1]